MAKSKTSKLSAGATVRIRDGAVMPENESLSIGGWTGMIIESSGRGDAMKYIIQWDAATQAKIPESYKTQCESQNLCTDMACINAADVEGAA